MRRRISDEKLTDLSAFLQIAELQVQKTSS